MKIRDGFISNSSSSSFLLIAKKDHFNECVNKTENADKLIKQLKKSKFLKEDTVFGENIIVVQDFMTPGGGGWWEEIEDTEDNDTLYSAWEKLEKELNKDKTKCSSWEQDW
jgi:hypothetical protein